MCNYAKRNLKLESNSSYVSAYFANEADSESHFAGFHQQVAPVDRSWKCANSTMGDFYRLRVFP